LARKARRALRRIALRLRAVFLFDLLTLSASLFGA
jgi:hypothetical protein